MLGVSSAYFGGRFDLIFQRVMDVFMAFPIIIMALALVAIFGTGTDKVIIAITILTVTTIIEGLTTRIITVAPSTTATISTAVIFMLPFIITHHAAARAHMLKLRRVAFLAVVLLLLWRQVAPSARNTPHEWHWHRPNAI